MLCQREGKQRRGEGSLIRDHSFTTFAKFSEKLTFRTIWYAHGVYQGLRNVTFSDNFANVINEDWKVKILRERVVWVTRCEQDAFVRSISHISGDLVWIDGVYC